LEIFILVLQYTSHFSRISPEILLFLYIKTYGEQGYVSISEAKTTGNPDEAGDEAEASPRINVVTLQYYKATHVCEGSFFASEIETYPCDMTNPTSEASPEYFFEKILPLHYLRN
jgi:hypothetical protein